jgi:hypothetical protein
MHKRAFIGWIMSARPVRPRVDLADAPVSTPCFKVRQAPDETTFSPPAGAMTDREALWHEAISEVRQPSRQYPRAGNKPIPAAII